MQAFLKESPLPGALQGMRDFSFLYHFESERHWLIKELLCRAGIAQDQRIDVLDVGFLHGLTQEFFHRAFPNSQIDVLERPGSPIFKDEVYMRFVRSKPFLNLIPSSLQDFKPSKLYDVIVIGEVIEHLDPSVVGTVLAALRKAAKPDSVLIITTPNAASAYNCYMTFTGKDAVQVAPIPDAMMGFGHIHLWSYRLLVETAKHSGWNAKAVEFLHGREAEKFDEVRRPGTPWKSKLFVRMLKFVATRKASARGFFVATFGAD